MNRLAVAGLPPLVLAAAALFTGCGPSADGDPELTVYLSAPLSGPSAADGRDIADGAELALADAGGEAAETSVVLEVLDDAGEEGWHAARTGANARRATRDSTAIAYIGELESGATRTSLPITNEAGMLQVSPGSGAEDLTSEALGGDQVPSLTQPSGTRSFGRVVPADRAQGEAAAVWMSGLEIASVEVVGGEDGFRRSLISGLESSSAAPAIVGEGEGAEAVYAAAESVFSFPDNPGVEEPPDLVAPPFTAGKVPLFGSDQFLTVDNLASIRPDLRDCETRTDCLGRPREIRATSAPLDPTQLPESAAGFLEAFEAEHGRPPDRYAAYGYEAMALVLDSIERADDPLDRAAVIEAFFATADRDSILGTYSIDEVGDTTLGQLGAYEIVDGRAVPEPEPLELP